MLNFETGSQILEFRRSQIYEKSSSQIFLLKFEIGSLFFVHLTKCIKIEEPDFQIEN